MDFGGRSRAMQAPALACMLLAWGACVAVLAIRFAGKGMDDLFITYRYALHLLHGQGFVFNPGERVFGLTNPGLALLLAALAWPTQLEIPTLATIVFGISLFAFVCLALWSASRHGRVPEALGGGTLLVTSSYLWSQQGGETIPMLVLLAGAAELGRGRRAAAALAGCLLTLTVAVSLFPASYRWHRSSDGWAPFMERYHRAGLWLAANSPPGASVSYYEVGVLGYYSDRTVVDLLGVVTPELLPYVRRGDFSGAFLARPADYAIFDTARGGLMPVAAPWFQAAYAPVAAFGQLTIFERSSGVTLPRSAELLDLH